MNNSVLIVPGYHGSGPGHWQTWLESRLPDSKRLSGINWERPELPAWSSRIHDMLDDTPGKVWIVAHSFGCLASIVAAAENPEKISGLLLVAPADPDRFSSEGPRENQQSPFSMDTSVAELLPQSPLSYFLNIAVISENDPWLTLPQASYWTSRWGSHVINAGMAGHINTESGYGTWPFILKLLNAVRKHSESQAFASTSIHTLLPLNKSVNHEFDDHINQVVTFV